jgi:hypothetical protein
MEDAMDFNFKDFASFRWMVTPIIIQILFWILVAVCIIGGLISLGSAPIQGVVMILLGPVFVRIYCELLMVLFRIAGSVEEIRRAKVGS